MKLTIIVLIFVSLWEECSAHGRMMSPLPRGSLWRDPEKRFNETEINYNDIENNCGGMGNQFTVNGGKCGLCGDPWQQPSPHGHEAGGKYDSGIIPDESVFNRDQEFTISIMVKAAHAGFCVFQLCPFATETEANDVTEACFANNQLELKGVNVTGGNRLVLHISYTGPYYLSARIPADFPEDTRALLRWKWRAGNSWGEGEDGTGMGFGDQEHFFSCADLYIGTQLTPVTDCLTRSQQTGNFVYTSNSACMRFCPSSPNCQPMVNGGYCSIGCLYLAAQTCESASVYGSWCVDVCADDQRYCYELYVQGTCAIECLD